MKGENLHHDRYALYQAYKQLFGGAAACSGCSDRHSFSMTESVKNSILKYSEMDLF